MTDAEKIKKAQQAVSYLLNRIRKDEAVRYHFIGTQSFELLTEAAAALFGEPVERVREHFGGAAKGVGDGRTNS